MDRFIIVICEGQHDIAFIRRILLLDGFSPYKKKLKDFPKLLSKQLITQLNKKEYEDQRLGYQSDSLVPSDALVKNQTLVLLHKMGGDRTVAARKELLVLYQGLTETYDFNNQKLNMTFIYIFDADNGGIEQRVQGLNDELKIENEVKHNQIVGSDGYHWGCYIFDDGSSCGTLEDILLGLVQENDRSIFDACETFLTDNQLPDDRRQEYICTSGTIGYKTKNHYHLKKSILSIAGQLQFSGVSNSVIIEKTDYFTKTRIMESPHYEKITRLFQ